MSSLLTKLKNARSCVGDAVRAWRRRHTHDWLSDRVKQEAREYRKAHKPRESLPDKRRQTWTRVGFWIGVAIALVFVLALSISVYLLAPDLVDDDRWYGLLTALWQVEASLAGVTFVIVALLLESRAKEARFDAIFRYYINACRLIPLVTATFLHILLLGVIAYLRFGSGLRGAWLDVSVIAVSMGFGLFVIANLLLWLKVLQLLGPTSLITAHWEIVRAAIEEATPAIAAEESGRRLLSDFLRGSRIYLPPPGFASEWWQLEADTQGFVTDLDLARLQEVKQELVGQPEGFQVMLIENLGDWVWEGTPLAVAGRKTPSDGVRRALKRAFQIGPAKEKPEDILARALQLPGDSALASLRTGQVSECQAYLDVYADSLRLLLDSWRAQPHALEFSERPKEYTFRSPRSRVVSILCEIVKRVMGQAVASGDDELVEVATEALSTLLRTSFRADQPGLYRLLTEQVVTVYRTRLSQRDVEFRVKAIKIWQRGSTDLVQRLRFSSELGSLETTSERAERFEPYLRGLIAMYASLLKSATDFHDIESYESFVHSQAMLRNHMIYAFGRPMVWESVLSDLGSWTDLAWFGVGAWILKRMIDGAQMSPDMLESACKQLADFGKLRGLHLRIQQDYPELSNQFGWDNWARDLATGSAQFYHSGWEWMRTFYCFQGARLLSSELAAGTSNPFRAAVQVEDEHEANQLAGACQQIRDAKDRLKGVIDEQTLAHLDEFVNLHRPSARPPDGYA